MNLPTRPTFRYPVVALGALTCLAFACKPTEESNPTPEPTATATVYTYPQQQQATQQQIIQQVPQNKVCDGTTQECAPDAKVVELCKATETDDTKCEPWMLKTLYEEYKTKLAGAGAGTCNKLYAKTATEGGYVNVRKTTDTSSDSNVLGKLNHGDFFCSLGIEGDWFKADYPQGQGVGYVKKEFVSTTAPAPLSKPSTSTTTTTTSGTSPSCTVQCPTGFFCAISETWLNIHEGDYFSDAREEASLRVNRLASRQPFCASTSTKNVQFFGGVYVMVKMRVKDDNFKTDYWMNCKYFWDAAQKKIGCQ